MHASLCAAAGLAMSLAVSGVALADRGTPTDGATGAAGTIGEFNGVAGVSARTFGDDGTRNVLAGETVSATITVWSAAGGAFLDDVPDTAVFGVGAVFGGANGFTGADMYHRAWQTGNTLRVSMFTANSSDIIPAGATLGGSAINQIRFEVGAFNAGFDPIGYPGYSPADFIGASFQGFSNGTLLFSIPIGPTDTNLGSGLAARGRVTNNPSIGGFDIDEVQIVFTLNVPTPGAASVFGLAGLAAVRRRRR